MSQKKYVVYDDWIERYDNPVGFIENYYGIKLSFWQRQYVKILLKIKKNKKGVL